MKTGILIVLVCLLLSVFSPLTVTHNNSQKEASLLALDVCCSSGVGIFGEDDDVPVIDERPLTAFDLEFAGFCDVSSYLLSPYILSLQRERPPEI
jgi:hypothetical protein